MVTMLLSTVPPVECKCAAAAAGPSLRLAQSDRFVRVLFGPLVEQPSLAHSRVARRDAHGHIAHWLSLFPELRDFLCEISPRNYPERYLLHLYLYYCTVYAGTGYGYAAENSNKHTIFPHVLFVRIGSACIV